MSYSAHVRQLRARADDLRRLARGIDAASVMTLAAHAGDSTWSGPRPTRCRELLAFDVRRLAAHVDLLRQQAAVLDQTADDLERAVAPLGGGR